MRAATALTAEVGLEGWTIRSLATALDSWPQVLYHHVGDRDAVAHAVVEEVVARFPVPDPDLPWREWFRELLLAARPILRAYPGVARRLVLRGPNVPAALPIIDHGVALLARSGLGVEAMAAYHVLFAGAMSPIAIEDDRSAAGVSAVDMSELSEQLAAGGEGLRAFAATLAHLRQGPDEREAYALHIYTYTLDRALDGIAARIEALAAGAEPLAPFPS
ncbi:TetR family transcriptional regulator (plasmid) [Embleya sp. NBC_00888]|uniref:TetR family transcriptional regulator n=1 Tax=Embleya sp. NBC_00888 TaxID=2975960 RepID=UPI002F9127E7|nr:TetR family transcriptional regulator [Embleya sp. NBC_00888]